MSEKDQNGYKTKQRQILLDYMRALSGRHVAINDIAAHFADLGEEIGTSTIYRQLNRLVAEGSVKKYVFPGGAAAILSIRRRRRSRRALSFEMRKMRQARASGVWTDPRFAGARSGRTRL